MKFEPLVLIRIANRNGIALTRIGNDICIRNASADWTPVIRQYKRKLIRHLPEDEIKSLQLDLFEDL